MNRFTREGQMMSSFGRVSKRLLSYRFKIISLLLGIHIAVIILLQLYNYLIHNTDITSFTGGVVMVMIFGTVLLSMTIEKTYTNDKYRLIPISDNTLYASNILTAWVTYLYLTIGEGIIYVVACKVFPNPYDGMMIKDFNSVQQYLFKFEIFIAFILGVLLVWTAITLIHQIINWINGFLPFKNQSFGKVILSLVVIWIFLIPFNFITANVLKIMGINGMNSSFSGVNHVILSGMAMMVLWIIVFTMINLYFLNKWSETTK